MNHAELKPTTLGGVKRLAKHIKRRDGISHAAALDNAATQAGFANFATARAAFSDPTDKDAEE